MATIKNYNYDLENEQLARRQKIADALMTGQLVGQAPRAQAGQAGWVSALQGFMPAIHAMAGQYAGGKVDADRAKLTERFDSDLKTGMEAFQQTSRTDRNKAIQDAMASNHPLLREYAMKEAARKQEGGLKPSDLVGISDPTSVLQNQQDTTKWLPKREKLESVDGVAYDPSTRETVALGGAKPETVKIDGDLYQRNPTTGKLSKLDNATKVTVPVNVNSAQKAGLSAYFTNAAKKVDELGAIAGQAQNNMQSIAELRNLDSQGIFSNVTTGPATFLANLGQAAGIPVNTAKLGNTESYNAITTDLWQGLVAKYGGNKGVTKEEAIEIKKMLPLAANSPQARQQMFRILENVAVRQVKQYQSANEAFARAAQTDDPTKFSTDFMNVYTPPPSTPAPTTKPKQPGKPSVSNW